jgi:hypothetical protein
MKRVVLSLLWLAAAVLSGCATQGPIPLDRSYWSHKPASVGIIVVKMPQPSTLKVGAQGILDLAINSAMADSLTKHLNSLSMADFREGGNAIARHFSSQGIPTKFIPEELDLATLAKVDNPQKGYTKQDYSALKARYGVEQLVVLEVVAAGTIRNYYGFIPLNAPKGYFACRGSLVDLSNNKLLWSASSVQQVVVEAPWDQSSEDYPHINTAFNRAMSDGRTAMVGDLIGSDTSR